MPKISEYGEATVVDDTSSVLGIQGGATKRFPLALFYTADNPPPLTFAELTDTPGTYVGEAGKLVKVRADEAGLEFGDPPESTLLALSDTPDAYAGQAGKSVVVNATETGVIFSSASIDQSEEPPVNPVDGQLWIDESQGVQDQNNFIDVTNFTTDYPLRRGETAVVNYSGATSVPLHIKTVEGVYEIKILGSGTGSTYSTDRIYLNPNNASLTAGLVDYYRLCNLGYTTGAASNAADNNYDGDTITGVFLGLSILLNAEISVYTTTLNKNVSSNIHIRTSATQYGNYIARHQWQDTTTVWTSLGTITFPIAQSGTIIIRRLY